MKLDKSRLPELETLAKNIRAKLNAYTKAAKELTKLAEDEAKLRGEIEKLDAETGYEDEAGIRAIETKRSMLGRLLQRIENVTNQTEPQSTALKDAMRQIGNILPYVCMPERDSLLEEITAQMLPLHGAREAGQQAEISGKFRSFIQFYFYQHWGNNVDPEPEAKKALRILDSVLDGKLIWEFAGESMP